MTTLRKQVEVRIKDQCALAFKEIAGAAGLESIADNRITPPSCLIYKAAYSTDARADQQYPETAIAIVICVANKADPRGGDSCDVSSELQDLVTDALCPTDPAKLWKPAGYDPMRLKSGGIVSFENAIHVYQMVFTAINPRVRPNYYG